MRSQFRRWLFAGVVFLAVTAAAHAQTDVNQLQKQLLQQPLYLRGFWMGQSLEFDATGNLMGDPRANAKNGIAEGPVTLSGVDVTDVTVSGNKLVLHGDRVALVADSSGRLQRQVITSTTRIVATVVFRKQVGKDEVKITVHADTEGSFNAALKAIFANGLAELAPNVPPYWRCYASGYFAKSVPAADAEKIVNDCVMDGDPAAPEMGHYRPVSLLHEVDPQYSGIAAEMHVEGLSVVHLNVGPHGFPVRLQIIKAAGAGLDEETLQAVAASTFNPATQDDVPVTAGFDFSIMYTASDGK
jgi:hypothetical protein